MFMIWKGIQSIFRVSKTANIDFPSMTNATLCIKSWEYKKRKKITEGKEEERRKECRRIVKRPKEGEERKNIRTGGES